jgi:hypothetical protein
MSHKRWDVALLPGTLTESEAPVVFKEAAPGSDAVETSIRCGAALSDHTQAAWMPGVDARESARTSTRTGGVKRFWKTATALGSEAGAASTAKATIAATMILFNAHSIP